MNQSIFKFKNLVWFSLSLIIFLPFITVNVASAQGLYQNEAYVISKYQGSNTCGSGSDVIHTTIDFGCSHKGDAVLDLTFAIIRILSDGVGLVLIGSLVYGGIQYTFSRGDPQAVAAAKNRIVSVLIALLIFIFAYAFLNYLIPGQFLQ